MRIKIFAGALAAGALLLGACGTDGTGPGTAASSGASVSASGDGGLGAGGDRDPCLIGTWQVDVNDLASQLASKLAVPGSSATGRGSITLRFGDTLTITYDNALTIAAPMGGSEMEIEAEFDGAATSADWTAKNGKIDGRLQTNTVTQNMKATVGGNTVPMPSIPFQGLMDFSGGNVGYTCAGSSASINGPGVSWKLTKA